MTVRVDTDLVSLSLDCQGDMKSVWKQLLCALLFLICIGMCLMCYMVRTYSFNITPVLITEREADYLYNGNTTSKERGQQIERVVPSPNTRTSQERGQQIERYGIVVPSPNTTTSQEREEQIERYGIVVPRPNTKTSQKRGQQIERYGIVVPRPNTKTSQKRGQQIERYGIVVPKPNTRTSQERGQQIERYGIVVPRPSTTTIQKRGQQIERYGIVVPRPTNLKSSRGRMLKPDLYVFSLSYMDQMSWASTRWRNLQCWASQLSQRYNIHVIEPFVVDGTHLGVPTVINHEVLKYSDIFDSSWQRNISYPLDIVSWDAFLSSGARNVVTVQIVYPYHHHCTENGKTDTMCNNERMQRLFSQHLARSKFTLMKSICINFRELDILTMEQFNEKMFHNIPENLPVTVMFDEWRGLGENSCIARVSDGNCSVYNNSFIRATLNLMTPSSRIKSAAQKYVGRYLRRRYGYVAIMIRWEKILLYDFYSYHNASQHYSGSRCLKGIQNYVKGVFKRHRISASFLTTDIGKYGSSTFGLYNSTQVSTSILTDYTEQLLRILYRKSLRLREYEQRFEGVSGSKNPAFISQLQKSIAARARCLLLVGWGSFHRNTLSMFKAKHKGQKLCYKVVMKC